MGLLKEKMHRREKNEIQLFAVQRCIQQAGGHAEDCMMLLIHCCCATVHDLW